MKKSPPSADGPRWKRKDIHERAGRYSRRTGPPKAVAARQGKSARYIQYVNAAERHGPPQELIDWLDRLCDGGSTRPYPLIAMLAERVHERRAMALDVDMRDLWRTVCERATKEQAKVTLRRLELRELWSADGPDAAQAFDAFARIASKQSDTLLEMCGLARVELSRRSK